MRPAEAIKEVQRSVEIECRRVESGARIRCPRGANALRNAELTVLSGNPSPSPPGTPPGRRSGFLRASWTCFNDGGGSSCSFGIRSNMYYSGYLEDGTHNKDGSVRMVARPFVDKITNTAMPEIERIFGELG